MRVSRLRNEIWRLDGGRDNYRYVFILGLEIKEESSVVWAVLMERDISFVNFWDGSWEIRFILGIIRRGIMISY